MDKFCEEKGFIGWYETSAKENINIEEASKFLVQKVYTSASLHHIRRAIGWYFELNTV